MSKTQTNLAAKILTTLAILFATAFAASSTGAPKPVLVARVATLSPTPFVMPTIQPIVEETVVYVSAPVPTVQTASQAVSGSCTPEYIAQHESGGNYSAQNSGSTASGKYQYLDSTWGGYGGYQHAKDAPPGVQEQRFQADYARSGGSMWQVCGFRR